MSAFVEASIDELDAENRTLSLRVTELEKLNQELKKDASRYRVFRELVAQKDPAETIDAFFDHFIESK